MRRKLLTALILTELALFALLSFVTLADRKPSETQSPPPEGTPAAGKKSEVEPLQDNTFNPEEAATLLKRNGFVVEAGDYRQIFEPYLDTKMPFFITVDSAFHTFHFIFEKCLKFVEFQNCITLKRFVKEMHGAAAVVRIPDIPEFHDARQKCLALLEVAAKLLDEPVPPLSGLEDEVDQEVGRIQAATVVDQGILFRRQVNYNRFEPAGFYVGLPDLERYFRAFCWLSTNLLRTNRPDETAMALILAQAFESSKEAGELWSELDSIWGYFIGPIDDLTLPEYMDALKGMSWGPLSGFTGADLAGAMDVLGALRKARIRSMLEDSPLPEHGMLVLGTRYMPESELFWKTTAPLFPRQFNMGLEVVSLMGSMRGLELMSASSELRERITRLAEQTRGQAVGPFYREMLDCFGLMIRGGEGPNPPFMETEAWKDKSVNTALASWALLRHSFALQAKLTTSRGCCFQPPSGFVEPFPELFAFLGRNAGKLAGVLDKNVGREARDELKKEADALKSLVIPHLEKNNRKQDLPGNIIIAFTNLNDLQYGVDGLKSNLMRFRNLMKVVESAARSQREGKTADLTEIGDYGQILQELHGYDPSDRDFDDDMPKSCVVCEYQIHERLLQVGIGRPDRICVLYPWKGNLVPCVGAVMSYREFMRPLSSKLRDEQWRSMAGFMTARPEWNSSFFGKTLDLRVLLEIASDPEVRKRLLRE